ncbi:hypothetical protein [Actinoplanes aureus]|uniref:Uncharacterized protein n=1 Tax=Actinoplanes aureus TaxID=2792083 RepID=A0A931G7M9_9ACTN|nr:hypothetical protein [Actinoplanes aureus]MBG0568424.1 hypothetical protein [Actinoplanes aureus]
MPSIAPALSNNDNNIAIIQVDDWFVHIAADVAEIKEQHNIGHPGCGLQFFDVEGYQLAPAYDAAWQLQALYRAPGPANAGTVRRRLQAWLRNYRTFAQETTADRLQKRFAPHQPPVFSDYTPAEVLAAMREHSADPPDIRGKPLADCFDLIRAFLRADGGDRGSMLHNAAHALGWTHS